MIYHSNMMKTDDVIKKLRQLKLGYISDNIGSDPGRLPEHLSQFMGYATLLYDYYAEIVKKYELKEAEVIKEENEQQAEVNKTAEKREDRITDTKIDQRVSVRVSNLKAEKKYLEVLVKGATLHVNVCQSLIKNWGDEAKGMR